MKITFTKDDFIRDEPHQPGWYKGIITRAATKTSSAGDSTNYEYTLKYETGIKDVPGLEERELRGLFNTKFLKPMRSFLAALAGKTLKEFIATMPAQGELEWEHVVGGKVLFKLENQPGNNPGQIWPRATDFLPYDYNIGSVLGPDNSDDVPF